MKLLNPADPAKNLLPNDGIVNYYGPVIDSPSKYFDLLLKEINWQQDQAMIFGKLIHTKRMVAWYAEENFEYSYSGIQKIASPWNSTLLELKLEVEKITNETYNSCLLNLYHDGNEGMAWHSDGEKDLKKNGAIASLTFGAKRKFSFKHKESKNRIDIILENGSLLLMKGKTQDYWKHRLPPSTKIKTARINLTFRIIKTK